MEQKDTRVAPSSSGSDGERVSKTNNRQQEDPNPSSQKPLNCPRCDSINTKFCYFNNYSNSQPRHFCKSCRRYWTQGGTLRNVPVGGGCRKNKRVRPRSLISMGGPTPFSDPTMLGRLSSCIPSFNGNEGDVDSSSQLLNIAYARFQESMRLTHQSPEGLHYDMSLPPLVQKPCALSSCTNLMMDGFEHNLGFPAAHSAGGDAGYRAVANYDLPSSPALYHAQAHNLMGTSATETLASIEEELSSFSNYPYHVINSVNTDASQERPGLSMFAESMPCLESGLSYVENSPIVDLLNAHGEDQGTMKEEEKPMISMNGDHNGLSLTMPAENWQPQALSSMNEGLFEPHQGNLWSTNTPRWLDMHPTSVL